MQIQLNGRQQSMTWGFRGGEEERDLMRLLYKKVGRHVTPGDEGRTIIVTAYPGGYGPAGFLLVVEGSPPRAIALYDKVHSRGGGEILVWAGGKPECLPEPPPIRFGKTGVDYLQVVRFLGSKGLLRWDPADVGEVGQGGGT